MSALDPPNEGCVVGTPGTGGAAGLTAAPGVHATTTDTGAIAAISVRTNAKTRTAEVEATIRAAHRETDPFHLVPVDGTEAAKTRIANAAAVPTVEVGQPTTVGALVLMGVRLLPMSSFYSSKR